MAIDAVCAKSQADFAAKARAIETKIDDEVGREVDKAVERAAATYSDSAGYGGEAESRSMSWAGTSAIVTAAKVAARARVTESTSAKRKGLLDAAAQEVEGEVPPALLRAIRAVRTDADASLVEEAAKLRGAPPQGAATAGCDFP